MQIFENFPASGGSPPPDPLPGRPPKMFPPPNGNPGGAADKTLVNGYGQENRHYSEIFTCNFTIFFKFPEHKNVLMNFQLAVRNSVSNVARFSKSQKSVENFVNFWKCCENFPIKICLISQIFPLSDRKIGPSKLLSYFLKIFKLYHLC